MPYKFKIGDLVKVREEYRETFLPNSQFIGTVVGWNIYWEVSYSEYGLDRGLYYSDEIEYAGELEPIREVEWI